MRVKIRVICKYKINKTPYLGHFVIYIRAYIGRHIMLIRPLFSGLFYFVTPKITPT